MFADPSPRTLRLRQYKFLRRIALRKAQELPAETTLPRTLRLRRYRINRACALRQGDEIDISLAVLVEVDTYRDGVVVDTRYHYDFTYERSPPDSPEKY